MKAEISLVTLWTDDVEPMKTFYHEILGFPILNDLGTYVEFQNQGVRFAICKRSVMHEYSQHFAEKHQGQGVELAFPCETTEELYESFSRIVSMGAKPIHEPQDMPWNQRTALFADPDGNIHELFTDLG